MLLVWLKPKKAEEIIPITFLNPLCSCKQVISVSIDLKCNRCNVNTVLCLEAQMFIIHWPKHCVVCRLAFTAHLTLIYDLSV